MGFSAKQVQALRRQTRMPAISGPERPMVGSCPILRVGTPSRRPIKSSALTAGAARPSKSKCVLARENRGTFLAVYVARVRVTVHADGATIIREGHGTGEGHGTSPGEVHDIALKVAETDATKRALGDIRKAIRP